VGLPPALGLFLVQYASLFSAVTTIASDSPLCQPSQFFLAWRGWQSGVCLTEEQIWCRANGNKHPDCPTADCRAEEVRFTVWSSSEPPPSDPVYATSGIQCAQEIHGHIKSMNSGIPSAGFNSNGQCGVCVPATDRRSRYLPTCSTEEAFCRGLYYRPVSSKGRFSFDCKSLPRNSSCAFLQLKLPKDEDEQAAT
jgi:hypothetical protein